MFCLTSRGPVPTPMETFPHKTVNISMGASRRIISRDPFRGRLVGGNNGREYRIWVPFAGFLTCLALLASDFVN